MISFFLNPARLKLLLYGAGALLLALAALLVWAVYLNGALSTERAAHTTTREKLATAVREGKRWKDAAEAAEPAVTALQSQVRECLQREEATRQNAAAREAIRQNARAVQLQSAPGEKARKVMDEATRHSVVGRLNRPL